MLIRIMACKEREEYVNNIISSLEGKDVEVIWDEKKDACDTLCRTLNSNEAMLVLEDDTELCKDFYEKAMAEIEVRPDAFIMFYSFWAWEMNEPKRKEEWKPYDKDWVYTQAYYVPAGIWEELAELLKDDYNANHCRYSIWINKFLVNKWIERYLVYPSLVQHISKSSLLEPWAPRWIHHSHSYRYE